MWRRLHPRCQQLPRGACPHLLADTNVNEEFRQKATIHHGRQGPVTHRKANSLDILKRQLLHVWSVRTHNAHTEHNFENVVHRKCVDTLIARTTQ
jgi:hypothetical protein